MSVSLDALRPECPTNWLGQYLIVPDGGTKAEAHTRVSTWTKTMEDRYNLERREKRFLAKGLAENPDLFAQVAATSIEEKKVLDKLCDKVVEAAGIWERANIGQALHKFLQRVVIGEELVIPHPHDRDIEVCLKTLHDYEVTLLPEYVERYGVLPEWKIGGRLDHIAAFGSTLKVADLKTGATLDFSWLAIAQQLALYSRFKTFYDPETKKHSPMPDLDQDVGLLIHLPAGEARCDLYWVDLQAGWQAAQHAHGVREWRRRKDLAQPWNDSTPVTVPDVRRTRLVERIEALRGIKGALKLLAARWPAGLPTFKQCVTHTPEELDAIAAALTAVEAEVGAPFGPLDPAA